MTTSDLTDLMVTALRDIDAARCGAKVPTTKALEARELIVPVDAWPFHTLTDAGRDALAQVARDRFVAEHGPQGEGWE